MSEIKDLMKEQMSRVIHPDDRERVAERFRAFDKSGLSYEIDYQIVRPDGQVRHVLELGEPVFDSTGRAIAHTGTIQDITESQRTEKALRESKERLKGALEQARLAYWWYSFSLNAITEWSAEAATILGISRERLPTDFQTYLESVFRLLYPEAPG
jgi:PAS domain-containing protein